jgi:arylsulfatase A-like enzyme/Flp pilus assembly protein TadD
MRRLGAGLALLAAAAALAACRRAPAVYPRAPIVLISIDTLRADRLPAYGFAGVATPALDALRRDGILGERAWSHTPLTLPSHASILSGLLPDAHGVRDNVGYRFDGERLPTLATLLSREGYATGGAVSSYVLRRQTGIAAGFDAYDDSLPHTGGESLGEIQRSGLETARRAREWLRGQRGRPFFLFLHVYEPHTPYAPPEPYRSRYADPYLGEIAAADAVVGEVAAELRALDLYDRSIVAVLSDHGEGLGDHGEAQHGIFLYRETLQVPLLLKLPGNARAGATVTAPVGLVDVAPTLLRLVGIAPPAAWPGASILDLLQSPPAERRLYAETFYPRIHLGWSELFSAVDASFHYIEGPEPELYDLRSDPGETRNVIAGERRIYAALRAEVAARDRALAPPNVHDEEALEKLAALGYLAGGVARVTGPLPDPKTQKPTLARIEEAFRLVEEGRRRDAIPILRQIVAANPNMQDIWSQLGMALRDEGEKEEALVALEEALELSGGTPSAALAAAAAHFDLGHLDAAEDRARIAMPANPRGANDVLVQVALQRGDRAAAAEMTRQAVAAGQASDKLVRRHATDLLESGHTAEAITLLEGLPPSEDPATATTLAAALSDAGRQDEARSILEQVAVQRPEHARAHELLGMVALRQGRPAEARDHLRRALELDERLANGWNTLGVALFQTEGAAAALVAWERAVALDPEQYDALLNIGLVAARSGRRAQAVAALRRFVASAPPERFAADLRKARGLLAELGA